MDEREGERRMEKRVRGMSRRGEREKGRGRGKRKRRR